MTSTRLLSLALAGAICAPASAAMWTPTNYGVGADAEVREFQPTNNLGASTEIASRVRNNEIAGSPNDGNDRNSSIYVKIDLTDRVMPSDGHTAFRMTYRNNSLNGSRIQDYITPNSLVRTGMAFYGLNTSLTWDESTITYLNAPGITADFDVGTKDFNSDLTLLGTAAFPEIGTQNHLPVGGALVLANARLDQFVKDALAAGKTEVTIVASTIHNGEAPFPNWLNFNYLFNPKEQTMLNSDNYDAGDGLGNIGNLYGRDNSAGAFSPALLLAVPEPSSVLLGVIALAGIVAARRQGLGAQS
ncbi:hypothetical protein Pla175_31560 [Pirellulimonas nuda]|uniref:Ice-binding protein C-terminal domain-containing protein n=1 Tax=Pirellulimonas nuda TaxID=2528009 RepID=A0A518DE61_9BACT|nr:PEP-CTERM sorting domain-containing protein [Pirellulimonas nuda]QDU89761.1 hypothetical protein Pla175_31560 [Pirellulimonas nuda]